MTLKKPLLLMCLCLSMSFSHAQNRFGQNQFVWDYRFYGLQFYDQDWSFTVGFNVLDDSGAQLERAPKPSEDWNLVNPLMLGAEFYFNTKLSFAALVSFNKMKEEKNIDSNFVMEGHEATYFAADLSAKLYVRDWIQSYFLDPYVLIGIGYTNIGAYKAVVPEGEAPPSRVEVDEDGNLVVPKIGRMTVNVGAGFNFWFNRSWAFTTGFMSKWGLDTKEHSRGANSISNQLQYTFGMTYFIKGGSIRFTGN